MLNLCHTASHIVIRSITFSHKGKNFLFFLLKHWHPSHCDFFSHTVIESEILNHGLVYCYAVCHIFHIITESVKLLLSCHIALSYTEIVSPRLSYCQPVWHLTPSHIVILFYRLWNFHPVMYILNQSVKLIVTFSPGRLYNKLASHILISFVKQSVTLASSLFTLSPSLSHCHHI